MNAATPKPLLYVARALPGGDLERLRALFEIRGNGARPPPREELLREARWRRCPGYGTSPPTVWA